MEIIKQRFAEHITLAQQVAESRILEQVAESAEIIRRALQNGKKVLFCGNGGSAADSQHLAAEFVGRFQKERNGLPAIALTVDTSILTAVANDYGYDTVFARQVQALGSAGDVLVGLSTVSMFFALTRGFVFLSSWHLPIQLHHHSFSCHIFISLGHFLLLLRAHCC